MLTWLSVLGGVLAVVLFRAWLVRARRVALDRGRDDDRLHRGERVPRLRADRIVVRARRRDAAARTLGARGRRPVERPTHHRRRVGGLRARGAVLVPARARGARQRAVGDRPARQQAAPPPRRDRGVRRSRVSITILVYVPIAALGGVRSVDGFRAWMVESQHGIRGIGGLPRMVVGFGRSLVNMDRLGLVTKRYLIHDPYNPTTRRRRGASRTVPARCAVRGAGRDGDRARRRPAGRRALALPRRDGDSRDGVRAQVAGRGPRAVSRDVPRALPRDRRGDRAARAARSPDRGGGDRGCCSSR